jgi:NADH-quinone oxidoreductase subunit M
MAVFAAVMMMFALSNVGLPGTSGFVGEFMIILSAVKANFWVIFLASTTLIWGAVYTLWMYKRVFFDVIVNPELEQLTDIQGAAKIALILLASLVVILGVYPQLVFTVVHT